MKPESINATTTVQSGYKIEAVKLVRERSVSVAQAARDLDIHENMLHKWVREFGAYPGQSFTGNGQMKPEHLEIERLLCQGRDMKFAFIAKHRSIWPVVWLCEALGVSRSGFHAWLNRSPSDHARSGMISWRKAYCVGFTVLNG